MSRMDNAHVQAEIERTNASFDDGIDASRTLTGPLPDFYRKPVYLLKPWEQGYVFGVWLREWLRGWLGKV